MFGTKSSEYGGWGRTDHPSAIVFPLLCLLHEALDYHRGKRFYIIFFEHRVLFDQIFMDTLQ